MKVTLITDRLTYNGRSTYALNLARGLSQSGWEVRVCTPGGDLRPLLDEWDIESYLVKYNLFSFRTLVGFVADFSPGVLHVTSERALRAGYRLARRLGRKYVLTVHDLLEEQALRLSPAHAIVVSNEALREVLVNRYGVPKTRIRLIPKGVDLALFDIPPISLDGRLPVIGSIGRLVPGKGQEVFIRAARQVLDQGYEVLFLLIGQGSEERRLRQLIRELDLAEAVTISPPIADPTQIYRVIDIMVLPATRAASSTTALEAMAARRPVIASCVGDLLHVVRHEENSLAVEPGNVESLARAVMRLVDNPAFARELGERARAFVRKRFPLSRMIDATAGLYRDIVEQNFPP